jgi:hypothetical protein
VVRRESRLLPGRFWTLDLVLRRRTAGVGILWELLPYPEDPELQADRLRVFLGPIAVTPWGEVEGLGAERRVRWLGEVVRCRPSYLTPAWPIREST